ncbi:hypothetical protein ACSFA8_25135 [Variovorax sp. RT4R15]|uniref:hypothetical protein n=1 Tax=Variovorax sp. RT4R15 TaxID=3443737 RepID=UPI003F46997D
MDRDEQAKRYRAARKRDRELRAEIKRDQFLQEWLAEIDQYQREFREEAASIHDLEQTAESAGFRTARAWIDARNDLAKLYKNFVVDDAFKKFWKFVRDNQDPQDLFWGYSPTNGGIPRRLIEAMTTWHQAPRFTASERRQHSKKIAAAAQALEDLLVQLEPSHDLDGQYSRFWFDDLEQGRALYRAFGDAEKAEKAYRQDISFRLSRCGVAPLWAVRNIKNSALTRAPTSNPLPGKVRAKNAKKTFFIHAVLGALDNASRFGKKLSASPQLVADVVALMASMDCFADDVRKIVSKRKTELSAR